MTLTDEYNPTNRPTDRPLLTVQDAAKQVSLTDRTLRKHIAAGRLKAYRIGGAIRVHPDDLDDFVCGW